MNQEQKDLFLLITKAEVGGAQMSVLNLAKQLHKQGVKVMVGFGEGEFLPKELKEAGIPYYRFSSLKRSLNPIMALSFMKEFYVFQKKHPFHNIHLNSTNTLFAAIAAKFLPSKPQTIFTFRGLSLIDQNYTSNWLTEKLFILFFKFMLLFIDKQVFVSKQNQEYCRKIGIAKRDIMIYNGLPYENFSCLPREKARKKLEAILGISLKDKFVIGSIGRLAYQKNYHFLVDAMRDIKKTHPQTIAIIIGDGAEMENLKQLTRDTKTDDCVFFAGSIPHGSQFLQGFDLFTLVSLFEGLSITLIEVLFAGTPALVSKVGGNHEQLPNDSDLFTLGDKEEFLKKLRIKIDSNESLKKYPEAKLFKITETARNYEKLLK